MSTRYDDLPIMDQLRQGLPLSEMIRPNSLKNYVGQKHLINDHNGSIKNFIKLGYLPLMILYGPPGVGKTTIARILSKETSYVFVEISATEATVSDLKELLMGLYKENNLRTARHEDLLRVVVFIDEIHRLTTTQQDFLLPFIEAGNFVFIGATTVDPKVRIRRAILSRCQMFALKTLTKDEVQSVLDRAIMFENMRRKSLHNLRFLHYDGDALNVLINFANGDTRMAINLIELVSTHYNQKIYEIELHYTDFNPISIETTTLKSVIASLTKVHSGLQETENIKLFENLFDSMRGIIRSNSTDKRILKSTNLPPIRRVNPNVRLKRLVPGCFFVKIKSKYLKPSITDSELESESELHDRTVRDLKIITEPHESARHEEWAQHIPVSDDSDLEPGNPYSDDDDDEVKLYDLNKISSSKFAVLSSNHTLVLLLQKGETPHYIMKQLILFAVLFVDSDYLELRRALSSLKALQNTTLDPVRIISNLIQRLIALPKHKFNNKNYPLYQLQNLKEYHRQSRQRHETSDEQYHAEFEENCEIVYDDELVLQLLSDLTPDENVASKSPPESPSNLSAFDVDFSTKLAGKEFSVGSESTMENDDDISLYNFVESKLGLSSVISSI